MPEEKLIKSKERVKKFAEVFTPAWVVKKMCDMLDKEEEGAAFGSIEKTFLDVCCGTGNFTTEIIRRKLLLCKTEEDAVKAVGTVYGVDIQMDNILECRERIEKQVHEVFPGAVVMPTLERNIVCGDFLNPVGIWFLEENVDEFQEIRNPKRKRKTKKAEPTTDCRQLVTDCKQLPESEEQNGE